MLRGRDSRAESLGGASFRFRGFFFAVPRRSVGFQRMEKARCDVGNLIDCSQECGFVGIRRFVKTADLSHELERSGSNLLGRDRRIEVEKDLDIPAHSQLPRALRIPKGSKGVSALHASMLNRLTLIVTSAVSLESRVEPQRSNFVRGMLTKQDGSGTVSDILEKTP
jgi:hypothetical protein